MFVSTSDSLDGSKTYIVSKMQYALGNQTSLYIIKNNINIISWKKVDPNSTVDLSTNICIIWFSTRIQKHKLKNNLTHSTCTKTNNYALLWKIELYCDTASTCVVWRNLKQAKMTCKNKVQGTIYFLFWKQQYAITNPLRAFWLHNTI